MRARGAQIVRTSTVQERQREEERAQEFQSVEGKRVDRIVKRSVTMNVTDMEMMGG